MSSVYLYEMYNRAKVCYLIAVVSNKITTNFDGILTRNDSINDPRKNRTENRLFPYRQSIIVVFASHAESTDFYYNTSRCDHPESLIFYYVNSNKNISSFYVVIDRAINLFSSIFYEQLNSRYTHARYERGNPCDSLIL